MSKERQLWLFERACGSSVSSWESRGDRVICTDFAASGRPYHRAPGNDVTLFKARLSDPTDDIDALKRAVNEEDATVSFHSGPRPTGPARKGCFLTESCCEEVGLSDDCFELTALRRYRGRVLAIRPGGAAETRHDYALAPVLLRALDRDRRKRDLLRLYYTHILPCALLATLGLNEAAHRRYANMMLRLCEQLAPEHVPMVQRISAGRDL
jgi:hypothetical protein